ncbi:single-stranded DNA-binding protein [Microbispora amethystogenes]|uniref:Single-stranded DNA-binding protein n=1 Tax=Microbispora amethystogenes TaxID=1427754 RepID=A0ABQ4F949_9ACTN|nr:single-stranded DNA-binding protein [Microbispora amethystogenes]GIH31330.1 hypothetical protein Mam01_14940 [Microbispora amethystogenes]
MSDIYVTLSGNVTDDPRQYRFRDGSRVTSMRMAVNRRVLDQQTNTWQTRDTTYYVVRCYRGLADNVQQSVRKGHPVVVYGKLRIKQFEREGEQRFWAEIEASSVGHDLKWGITTYEKPIRAYSAGAVSDDDRQAMEDATREWELTGRTAPGAPSPGGLFGGTPSADGGEADEAFDALVGGRSTTPAERPALGAADGERGGPTAGAELDAGLGTEVGTEVGTEPGAEGDAGVVTSAGSGAGPHADDTDDADDADDSLLPRALAA